jgi:HEAT repeat protein
MLRLEKGETALDHGVVAALLELAGDSAKEVAREACTVLALAARSSEHRRSIEGALGDGEPRRRWGAAFALARAGFHGDAVVQAALEAAGASDGDVRWAAIEVLRDAARERPGLVQKLVRVAATEAAPVRRKMVLYCLRDLGHADAEVFVRALGSADSDVRLAGLSGLARLARPDPAVLRAIVACMEGDREPGVRRAAAATLGRMGSTDPSVSAALERAKASATDPDLARAASSAMSRAHAQSVTTTKGGNRDDE